MTKENRDTKGYTATLRSGKEIYIPSWPASVALENLTKAGEIVGANLLINISKLNMGAVISMITDSKNSEETAGIMKHFICTARVNGEKITNTNFDTYFEGRLELSMEIFAHVIKAQYSNFFELGLVEETCQ